MVCSQVPPVYGGAGTQALALGRELVARGVDVEILTQNQFRAARVERVDDVLIRRSPGEAAARRMPRRVGQMLRTTSFSLWLVVRLSLRRYDVYHAHGNYWFAIVLSLFAHVRGVPLVVKVTRLGEDDIATASGKRLAGIPVGFIYAWPLRSASLVIALNGEIARLQELIAPLTPTKELPNGVDVTQFGFCPNKRLVGRERLGIDVGAQVVLFVGYLAPHKGVRELLEAWSTVVRERDGDLVLALVGPSDGFYRELGGEFAVNGPGRLSASNVRFIQDVAHGEMPMLYAAADVFVLPTAAEGMPNSLLEALAAGLPTIASRVPGVVEVVADAGEYCLLLDNPSASAIAGAIADSLCRVGTHASVERPPHLPARFTLASVASEYVRIYGDLVSRQACALETDRDAPITATRDPSE